MSWPANPTNGQQVTINGVIYEYDSTPGVWNRIGSGASSVTVDSFTIANLSVTNQAHLGDVNDVIITGGSANYSLTTDGNGNLSWSAIGNAVVPGGANTQVQFNNSGNFEGSANLTFNKSTNVLTVTGNVSVANITSSSYSIVSVDTGISAAGTVQANATALTKEFNVVSTVASGAGVALPTAISGMRITILNTSANSLLVYPATSGIINSQSANASYSQPAGARLDFISTTTTQWYTLNTTYG